MKDAPINSKKVISSNSDNQVIASKNATSTAFHKMDNIFFLINDLSISIEQFLNASWLWPTLNFNVTDALFWWIGGRYTQKKIIVMPMLAYRGNILKCITVRRNRLWASMDNNPKEIRSTKQRIQSARKERITLALNGI